MKKIESNLYTSEEGNELTEILYTADCRGLVWTWVIDRRISDYAECEAEHTVAAAGALKELRHIQKMLYIINAGNKVEE